MDENIMDYKQTKRIANEENMWLEVYDRLHECGIPYNEVHYFRYNLPYYSSGFSMGEIMTVKCNGNEIHRIDRTKEYSKSCKWKAKHGYIVINFTKKGLRDYMTAAKRGDGFAKVEFTKKYLDVNASRISNNKKW